jgi:Arm DNA-binding domain
MSSHKYSASTPSSASTLLPSAEVISLLTAKRSRAGPGTFTKVTVRRMRCPAGQSEAFFWDTSCGGFGMRTLHSGRRTWVYQYRDVHGRTRRIALGDVSAVGLDAAREEARRKAASVAQGANPSVERKAIRTAGSVLDLVDAYLRYAKERQRPRSYKETERHLRIHAAPTRRAPCTASGQGSVGNLTNKNSWFLWSQCPVSTAR